MDDLLERLRSRIDAAKCEGLRIHSVARQATEETVQVRQGAEFVHECIAQVAGGAREQSTLTGSIERSVHDLQARTASVSAGSAEQKQAAEQARTQAQQSIDAVLLASATTAAAV